uniref:HTH psq-type domain-containing protein n=1 Tax=Heterorhabditis bacteriophora TaxID=37862 RepID=A0A1I7X4C7_HETBA
MSKEENEVDTVEDCPRDGQHRPVNTPCLLKIVKNSMLCNTTMRKLAPFLHINATPMSRVTKVEKGLSPNKVYLSHTLA